MNPRKLLQVLPWLLLGLVGAAKAEEVRFGIADSLPFSHPELAEAWRSYLEPRLGRELRFLRRPSHNDVVNLLVQDRIDLAWICPAHYQRHSERLPLIATPLHNGLPRFQVLLIAPTDVQPPIADLDDLTGAVVAFAEPDTALGAGQLKQALSAHGRDPEHYFRRLLYTGDHEQVVQAVVQGLAHAGVVMDQVWERMRAQQPALGEKLRVIWRSGSRPLPPIVAAPSSDPELRRRLRDALLTMHEDPAGMEILGALRLDRFSDQPSALFAPSAPVPGAEPALANCGD